jgi:hypothetical protein
MLVGSDSPIDLGDRRLGTALGGAAGEYLTRMGWKRDEVATALTTGTIQSWSPGDPRNDRDVNTDMFPKDEYH